MMSGGRDWMQQSNDELRGLNDELKTIAF